MEDVSFISLADTTWSLQSKSGKGGVCNWSLLSDSYASLTLCIQDSYTILLQSGPSSSVSLFICLFPLSFSITQGCSTSVPSCTLISRSSPPFILFIHTTGSLLIICDLLKYIHCFPPLSLSLSQYLRSFLSMSFISPLFAIPTVIHEQFILVFSLLTLSHSLLF